MNVRKKTKTTHKSKIVTVISVIVLFSAGNFNWVFSPALSLA